LTQYDARILQSFADDLYAKARWITAKCCFVGAIIGMAVTFIPVTLYESRNSQAIIDRYKGTGNGFDVPVPDAPPSNAPILVLVVGVLGGLVGYTVGQRKAFQYKLQAQLTLCQMQTEFNTRQT
jgi:hypothetical protein